MHAPLDLTHAEIANPSGTPYRDLLSSLLALRNAYAIGGREPGLLMVRRENLHQVTGRDLKTIAGYEDRMIEELASRILGRTKREVSDSHVFVIGQVVDRRLVRVTVTVRFPSEPGGDVFERTVDYENKSAARSMPALLYQLPHDWEPASLTLAVGVVVGEATPEFSFWATTATELLSLMFAERGQQLALQDGRVTMHVEGPKVGVIYAIYWAG